MTNPTPTDREAVERLQDTLGGITVPDIMHGDNLAIALCTAYDNPDQDTDEETGWTPDAISGQEAVLAAIRAHYEPVLRALLAERDYAEAKEQAAVKEAIEAERSRIAAFVKDAFRCRSCGIVFRGFDGHDCADPDWVAATPSDVAAAIRAGSEGET